jgi:lipoate-protein ligase B
MAVRPLRVLQLPRSPYGEVEALQERLRARVVAGDLSAEALLLVEHEPVVTLGRRAGDEGLLIGRDVLAARGVEVQRASRGGAATYHGPGQLVVYPVVMLQAGVVAHVAALAGAVVTLARMLGVDARYDRARPGVWVGERKLASIGVHVHRRVAIHGLALNVTRASLDGFSAVVPCATPGLRLTSLEHELGVPQSVDALRPALARLVAAALRCVATPSSRGWAGDARP